MNICCLDLEGVLIPEVWQAIAKHCGNKTLLTTTRDIADYSELMDLRLAELRKEDLCFTDMMNIVKTLQPFAGAKEFLDGLRSDFQVVILSDTFYEFVPSLMKQLNYPTLLCHHLVIENDRIIGYNLRQTDPKRKAVDAFKSLNYKVVAAGDSLNDCSMLSAADYGVLFRASDSLKTRMHHLEHTESYAELTNLFRQYIKTSH